jgi:hypothetical protein
MSAVQEKANLARIRDNQRRSRARRKEYLQELEARLRQCELQGIEASSEIQHAARKVVDENKKLRVLLSRYGVSDDNIEGFLHGTASSDAMTGDKDFAGKVVKNGGCAVQALEQLLKNKKHYHPDGTRAHAAMAAAPRESRESSVTSMCIPNFNQTRRQSESTPISSAGAHITPSSDSTRCSSIVNLGMGGGAIQTQQQPKQHQQQTIMPSAGPSMSGNTNTTSNISPHTQTICEFDPQASLRPPEFQQHQTTTTQLTQARTASQPLLPASRHYQYIPTTMENGNLSGESNCLLVADIITSITDCDTQNIKADLGCMPHVMECQVDNQLVFNVIDKYSVRGIGL